MPVCVSSFVDVIMLTGTDVGVNRREASKIWQSILLGFVIMCCGVKKDERAKSRYPGW